MAKQNDNPNQCPDVDGEDKLEQCLGICIHPIVKASLDAEVKVEPGNEGGHEIAVARWEEDVFVDLDDVGVKDETIDGTDRDSERVEKQEEQNQHQACHSKRNQESKVATCTHFTFIGSKCKAVA